ncbi:MAG: hypothetical protein JNN13_10020 [Planctomycetes bacterium]|nr:hypothetical protein [Planctomycetota bacterium]
MNRSTRLVLSAAVLGASLLAQSNERGANYDGALTDISSARAWGRRGLAYPNGEVSISFQNQLCNPGTIPIEWRAPGGSVGSTILSDHPKFGFLVAREVGGRLVQISDWSYCKHAFYALASPSTCTGTCVPPAVAGTQLGVKCSDIYSNSNNASRTYLGPPAEINPWLGSWPATGNYFDVGDPAQSNFPQPADGIRSLNTTGFDNVKNRVTIREQDLVGATSQLFFQIHVIHEGERVENRANNVMSRPFGLTWGGSSWTASTSGTATLGSILTRWPGATITSGSNGGTGTHFDDDGRFLVAVKVSGPVGGMWHYEYVVQNLDNDRGGASFRLPICDGARVSNLGFRDIDQNPLNDWLPTVANGEITFTDGAGNPHNWNTLYNFWFDCDVAPTAGNASIDQARPGPGALTVTVPTTVPGHQPALWLAGACGTPTTDLEVNGVPAAGNLAFALEVQSGPNVPVLLFFSGAEVSVPFGGGCEWHLDLAAGAPVGLLVTDGNGPATVPIPVNAGQTPADLWFQGASFVPAPPVLGLVGLSNALQVRFASSGCN